MNEVLRPGTVGWQFSRAAVSYDRSAGIQADLAAELAARIGSAEGRRMLDVGAGTGRLVALVSAGRAGRAFALDIASGMVAVGSTAVRGCGWVQGAAERLPFADGSFELVMSASAYQWSGNLSRAFYEARRVLSDGGRFQVVMFGQRTLQELFQSLSAGRPDAPATLPSEEAVGLALTTAGFGSVKVLTEQRTVHFASVMDILVWLKDVGANARRPGVFLGRELLKRAEQYYHEHFSDARGLRAGFEVIWIEAVR